MNIKNIAFVIILLNMAPSSFCTFPKEVRDKYVENQKAAYAKMGIGTLYMLPALFPVFAPKLLESYSGILVCLLAGTWHALNGGAMTIEGFNQRNRFRTMAKTQERYQEFKKNYFDFNNAHDRRAFDEYCRLETAQNEYIVECLFDHKFLSGALLTSAGLIAFHYAFKPEQLVPLYGILASVLLGVGAGMLRYPKKSCMPTFSDYKKMNYKGKTL